MWRVAFEPLRGKQIQRVGRCEHTTRIKKKFYKFFKFNTLKCWNTHVWRHSPCGNTNVSQFPLEILIDSGPSFPRGKTRALFFPLLKGFTGHPLEGRRRSSSLSLRRARPKFSQPLVQGKRGNLNSNIYEIDFPAPECSSIKLPSTFPLLRFTTKFEMDWVGFKEARGPVRFYKKPLISVRNLHTQSVYKWRDCKNCWNWKLRNDSCVSTSPRECFWNFCKKLRHPLAGRLSV